MLVPCYRFCDRSLSGPRRLPCFEQKQTGCECWPKHEKHNYLNCISQLFIYRTAHSNDQSVELEIVEI